MTFIFSAFKLKSLFFLFIVTHVKAAPQFQVTPAANCTLILNCVKLNVPTQCSFGEFFNGTNCIILIHTNGAGNNNGIGGAVTLPNFTPNPIPPDWNGHHPLPTPIPAHCPSGYQWDGRVCHASHPDCPSNYKWNGVACSLEELSTLPIVTPGSVTEPLEKPLIVFSRPPHIVTTEKPSSYPPKPKCYLDYEWNGRICVKNVSIPTNCPPNYSLADNKCQHVVTGNCPRGYRLQNSQCVGDRVYPVDCPPNYTWNGESCVNVVNACPLGYKLTADGSQCERSVTGSCPIGTYLENNRCIGRNVANIECPSGYRLNGNECIQYTSVCQPGYHLINNKCEQILTAHPVPNQSCAAGFEFINGECVSLERKCPNGYRLNGNICIEIAPSCPTGYEYNSHDSTCIQLRPPTTPPPPPLISSTYAPPVICPGGYLLVNNRCVPATPSSRPSPQPKCPKHYSLNGSFCVFSGLFEPPDGLPVFIKPTCEDGFVFNIDECVRSIEDHNNRPGFMTPHCPRGYRYDAFNNKCLATNAIYRPSVVDPICLNGFILVRDQCLAQYNPPIGVPVTARPLPHTPTVCPFGYTWSNNICIPIQAVCPAGYIFYGNACYLKPTPHPEVINGNVQIQTSTENTYWEPNVSYIPPKCPTCDQNKNQTQEISITTVINNNNTIYNPINIVTNHSNAFEVRIYRGENNVVTSSSMCSGGVQIKRDNETIYQPFGENCTQPTVQVIQGTQETQPDKPQQNEFQQAQSVYNQTTDSNEFLIEGEEEEEKEEEVPCCEIVSPRQCKRMAGTGDDTEWICYHRKFRRCGTFCTQPKIYLKPRRVIYIEPVLIMPPPSTRWIKNMNRSNRLNAIGNTN